jgi:sucrose phosphorylase
VDDKHRERIADLARFIYGLDAGGPAGERIAALARDRRAELSAAGALRGGPGAEGSFTEKDALLIAYGDMVSDPSGIRAPLRILSDFLAERGRGLFSYVHALPFFPYSSDDGFSVIDYRAVDPRLGSWEDIERLGAEFRLVFDLVLNHGSARSDWFRAFLAGDPRYASWYLTRPAEYDASAVFRPRTHPLLTNFRRSDGVAVRVWTTFSADQVDFDFGNPEVLVEFVSIMLDYARRGCRLLRLDAIAYLWKEDGTPCIHHPKTHAVVKLLRAVAEYLDLDLRILTETNVAHRENVSYYGEGDEAHLVYNFALPPLLLHAAVSGDAGPLRRWAASLPRPGEGPVFLNFTASHDGIGVGPAAALVPEAEFSRTIVEVQNRGGRVSFKATPSGPVPYELNCVYLDAVAPPDADDRTRARAFLATQAAALSLAGVPAVYFHSWVGSRNWTVGAEKLGYNRAINRERPELVSLESDLSDPASLRALVVAGFGRLLSFRAERPCFSPESPQRVLEADRPVFAVLRGPDPSGRSALCAANLSSRPASLPAPEDFGGGRIELGPWETRWIDSKDGGTLCI